MRGIRNCLLREHAWLYLAIQHAPVEKRGTTPCNICLYNKIIMIITQESITIAISYLVV
jgi:hypothetical protein